MFRRHCAAEEAGFRIKHVAGIERALVEHLGIVGLPQRLGETIKRRIGDGVLLDFRDRAVIDFVIWYVVDLLIQSMPFSPWNGRSGAAPA